MFIVMDHILHLKNSGLTLLFLFSYRIEMLGGQKNKENLKNQTWCKVCLFVVDIPIVVVISRHTVFGSLSLNECNSHWMNLNKFPDSSVEHCQHVLWSHVITSGQDDLALQFINFILQQNWLDLSSADLDGAHVIHLVWLVTFIFFHLHFAANICLVLSSQIILKLGKNVSADI